MPPSKRLTRRKCRELIVSMLYEYQLSDNDPKDIFQHRIIENNYSNQTVEFIEHLFQGIISQMQKIDEIISQHLIKWDFQRVAPVEKNILRLATFEYLTLSSTPPEVIINEAVEISKLLGSTHSSQFINAVLDKIGVSLNLL